MQHVLSVRGLSKLFPVFDGGWSGLRYLWHMARGRPGHLQSMKHVKALDDVSFDIKPGERVGLIGRNGSGKTTLLRLIAGTLIGTRGEIDVEDDIYLLSGSTVAFNADSTVRENVQIFLSGHVTDSQSIARKAREIEDFVELGPYFDQPTKYSSLGMQARSAFAAATAVEAPLILVDEVLGAGDLHWAERCAQRVEAFCAQGHALLLVSHSTGQILRYCERVLWIDAGRIVMDGEAHDVVRRYEGYLERLAWLGDDIEDKTFNWQTERQSYEDVMLEASGNTASRWPGVGDVTVNGLWLNGSAELAQEMACGMPLKLRLSLRCHRPGSFALRYTLTFWSVTGKRLGIAENDRDEVTLEQGEQHPVSVEIPPDVLGSGVYFITISVFGLSLTGSTANESEARQDILYKSVRLSLLGDPCRERAGRNEVRFRIPMQHHLARGPMQQGSAESASASP